LNLKNPEVKDKFMEIVTLTAFLSPFLPTLLRLGGKAVDKATESTAGKFGGAAFAKAQADSIDRPIPTHPLKFGRQNT
jgi:hypothetical protein